ncbi:helix-turn-helix domain-containing protein [Streptomyces canus]|uniref:ArsR/SmtB family transcription factor n=1 Tax=Streptomyces canus TaxID=58343 RepID=UPI0022548DB1|nr:helix-turn-helix domain-containing protein [Streptomyces canus]MCX4855878.1 helix-turn-helix domain-containing protein [Streptomyces canus]WSW38626.1 helix-turn-helix domain-containing protein [Streptomyces canus]
MQSDNRFGDMEITDPKAMRALAHPVRLAILERLQRHGPATATQLSPHVGATPSVASWHLRHLAGFGLVRDAVEGGADRRERRWEAVARGFRFEAPEDEDGRAAAQLLAGEMFARTADLPMRWLTETGPGLEQEWVGKVVANNTRIVVTADELAALKDAMEELLAPYVTRGPARRPQESRGVRVLLYALPEAADGTGDAGATS